MADSLILMVLALVVFGPRRLPQIGRQIGKLMYEFRKASNDFKFQMEEELRLAEEEDRRKKEEEERQRVAALAASSQASVSAPAPSIEAQADIGAVEPATAVSSEAEMKAAEPYPQEASTTESESINKIPHLQPPRTGEQVSTSAPLAAAADEATAELNPEATAAANAESVEAMAASNGQPGSTPVEPAAHPAVSIVSSEIESPVSPKEPVSQHG